MKLAIPKCPHCGNPAIGTVDTIPGVALFDGDPSDGAVDYAGSTQVDWDTGRKRSSRMQNRFLTCGITNGLLRLMGWKTNERELEGRLDDEVMMVIS